MKKRTRWIAVAVTVLVLAGYGTYLGSQQGLEKDGTIKVGAILQLSGGDAQYGEWSRKGIDIAVDEINMQGGIDGRKLEVDYEDSMSQATAAVSAFRKLRDLENVSAILTQASVVTLALAPLSNKEKVVQMDVGSVTPKYRTENDFTFRTAVTALQLAESQARIIAGRNITEIGYLYVNDDYGIGMHDVFKKTYESLGGKIAAEEAFSSADTDFRTQLAKIKEKNLSAVVFVNRLDKSGTLLRQARESGIEAQIFTDVYGVESQQTLTIAGEAAEGVLYVAPAFDVNASKASMEFVSLFRERYKTTPVQLSAQAYDGTKAVAYAMRGCIDTECMMKNLDKTDFDGASGRIRFDSAGELIGGRTELKTIRNGAFVEVK